MKFQHDCDMIKKSLHLNKLICCGSWKITPPSKGWASKITPVIKILKKTPTINCISRLELK